MDDAYIFINQLGPGTLLCKTDTLGNNGWGTYWPSHWLQAHWSPIQQSMDITWKELYAIVIAAHTWGLYWQRKKILFHCDNKAVVDIWEKVPLGPRRPWLKCAYYIFVQLITTLMYALCMYRVYAIIYLTLSLSFLDDDIQEISSASKHHTRQHPCFANAQLYACLLQCTIIV